MKCSVSKTNEKKNDVDLNLPSPQFLANAELKTHQFKRASGPIGELTMRVVYDANKENLQRLADTVNQNIYPDLPSSQESFVSAANNFEKNPFLINALDKQPYQASSFTLSSSSSSASSSSSSSSIQTTTTTKSNKSLSDVTSIDTMNISDSNIFHRPTPVRLKHNQNKVDSNSSINTKNKNNLKSKYPFQRNSQGLSSPVPSPDLHQRLSSLSTFKFSKVKDSDVLNQSLNLMTEKSSNLNKASKIEFDRLNFKDEKLNEIVDNDKNLRFFNNSKNISTKSISSELHLSVSHQQPTDFKQNASKNPTTTSSSSPLMSCQSPIAFFGSWLEHPSNTIDFEKEANFELKYDAKESSMESLAAHLRHVHAGSLETIHHPPLSQTNSYEDTKRTYPHSSQNEHSISSMHKSKLNSTQFPDVFFCPKYIKNENVDSASKSSEKFESLLPEHELMLSIPKLTKIPGSASQITTESSTTNLKTNNFNEVLDPGFENYSTPRKTLFFGVRSAPQILFNFTNKNDAHNPERQSNHTNDHNPRSVHDWRSLYPKYRLNNFSNASEMFGNFVGSYEVSHKLIDIILNVLNDQLLSVIGIYYFWSNVY